MEKIVEQAFLYDFYGELLTEHQKNIYEDAAFNDYSLSEIADKYGISRQGVHDCIKRVDGILTDYESKLHLIDKYLKNKEKVKAIENLCSSFLETTDDEKVRNIQKLARDIIDNY